MVLQAQVASKFQTGGRRRDRSSDLRSTQMSINAERLSAARCTPAATGQQSKTVKPLGSACTGRNSGVAGSHGADWHPLCIHSSVSTGPRRCPARRIDMRLKDTIALLWSGWFVLGALCPPLAAQSQPAAAPVVLESPEQLQQLVAPIALYPDELVAQILAAATYPTEAVEADRWLQQHSNLKGKERVRAVDQQPWDSSVKALTQFPCGSGKYGQEPFLDVIARRRLHKPGAASDGRGASNAAPGAALET